MTVDLGVKWTSLRYHEEQAAAWSTTKKFVVLVAGRGSGKTELARRKIVSNLPIKKPWSNPIYIYALPTYNQAKKVAWTEIQLLIPRRWIPRNGINVSDMSIRTIFGSMLYVVGMDKPQRVEGLQVDLFVLDESSDHKLGIMKTVSPMLTHRNAQCWRIGVPKRSGIGRIEFRDVFEKGKMGDPDIHSGMWKSSTVLTEEQLNQHRSQMSEEDFAEQFEAVWLDAGGSIYHAFSEANISDTAIYDPTKEILVGTDFNVDPMCWTLSHYHNNVMFVFDEIFLKNTNTERTLNHLHDKYGYHESGWKFYGDSSARARKTSTGRTDYIIIKNDERFKSKMVYYPPRNPLLKDRYQTVNAVLKNAKGENRVLINPRCKHLINDFRIMAYKEGTSDPENYTGTDIGHTSDGFGYMVCRIAPLKVDSSVSPAVVTITG